MGGFCFIFLFLILIVEVKTEQGQERDRKELFGDTENEIPEFEVFTPIRTDNHGKLRHRIIRSEDAEYHSSMFFNISGFGQTFNLRLQKNLNIIDPNLKFTERHSKNHVTALNVEPLHHCIYNGEVSSHQGGIAAFTVCDGLYGFIRTSAGDYFVQPLPQSNEFKKYVNSKNKDQHIIYKRTQEKEDRSERATEKLAVDYLNDLHNKYVLSDKVPSGRNHFGYPFGKDYNGPPNAAHADKLTVETAIFVDKALVDYLKTLYIRNSNQAILKYLLTIINGIQLLYNIPSYINKQVHFVLMKVEIFSSDDVGFEMINNSTAFMNNFCNWQMNLNPGNDYHPDHWDHAFMFTGIDIKTFYPNGRQGDPIGVAPVGNMCTVRRSCTLVEGKYFVAVTTAAHEAGHNFGMPHDGEKNDCNAHTFIMGPRDERGQVTWSSCSREYALRYLLLPWTVCLLDSRETNPEWDHSGRLPGERYSIDQQCEHVLGRGALPHPKYPLNTICNLLVCHIGQKVQKAQPALEGSECTIGMWCRGGKCVPKD